MEPPVTGQVAIVTGAGQGIGRDIALRLASDGMDVVIADLQRDLAERVANEVRALGRRTLALGVDVTTRHVIDHLNRFWRGLNNVSILGDDDVIFRNTQRVRHLRMQHELAGLTMNRHEEFWPDQVQHQLLLFLGGVTRNMDIRDALIIDLRTLKEQAIDRVTHTSLVPRHRCGRENDRIAWLDAYQPVLFAMRVSAEVGSPWLPVHMITTRSGGNLLISSARINMPAGIFKYPNSIAICTLLTMLRPTSANTRS